MKINPFIFDLYHPHPLLIVISGTSGIGKDAVLNELKGRNPNLHFVVTATSRAPRNDEVDGKDYFFYSRQDFERRIGQGEFIEFALVYQDYKGIPRSQIDEALKSGRDVIIKVDVQGADTLRQIYPEAVLIFLIPSTSEEWFERLKNRNSETPENFKVRIETAQEEVKKVNMFDYLVINADDLLEKAVDDILAIIDVEHHKVHPRKLI
ncbi:MAG: guanylate kinase [Chloroflexi bacterium]|nr:guanylate kinase [Chloroflexota bacterium]